MRNSYKMYLFYQSTRRTWVYTGISLLIVLVLGLSSCSNLKYLEEGQELYTGSDINIQSDDPIDDKDLITSELENVITPEPNNKLLGLRPWLWVYNVAGEPTGKGIRYFLRNRIGNPPVLFEEVDLQNTRRLMENRLINLGYFNGRVSYQVNRKRKKASVDYTVHVDSPYVFGNLFPLEGEDSIVIHINRILEESLIREGRPYRLETLSRERQRIDEQLKEMGYFYFQPDAILFRADSSSGEKRVDLYPVIKPEIPSYATRQYVMGDIFIYADYLINENATENRSDTIFIEEGLFLFDSLEQYNKRVFDRSIFLQKNELYNMDEHNRTLNHLTSLGVFRFINMRFFRAGKENANMLDANILLTPMDKKSISAEVRGVTKSNNFAGPGLEIAFTNRNFLGAAEDFRISVHGAYETLVGQQQYDATILELGGEARLSFPRFLLPFGIRRPVKVLSPKTNIIFGINYLNRTDAFELASVNLSYDYAWNRTTSLYHRFAPLVVSIFSLGKIHEEASGQILDNLLLRQSLFEQFIFGSEYSFFYNTLLQGVSPQDLYFNLNLDSSGNLAWLVNNMLGNEPDEGFRVFDRSYAQYFKSDFDVRYYRRLTGSTRLATRLMVGAGFPYGNSDQLPYMKQFIAGGSNSIRAFHPRSIGPGAYAPPDSLSGRFNIHQAGNLKLEANVEYRIDITSVLKGAVFVDAGNVWRLEEDEDVPGGKFSTDTFLEQLAMGAGVGLRIDVNFFLLRFDFAFPLAIPYTEHDGFFEPVKPFRNNWLLENMVFNLGIGYPF